MTQEEKDLLLKDLCARLPYECMLRVEGDWFVDEIEPYDCKLTSYSFMDLVVSHDCDVKPYLRPMSSMTAEEKKVYDLLQVNVSRTRWWLPDDVCPLMDWLNEHHFDYRGLIPKGLAIEVTEENNPYK